MKNGTPSFNTNAKQDSEKREVELPKLTDDQINDYLSVTAKAAKFKSVGLTLGGIGLALFFAIMGFYESIHYTIFPSTAIITTLITWAISVGFFIYGFLLTRDFYQIKRKQFTLTNEQLKQIQNKQKNFHDKNNKRIIAGVVLCILAIIPPLAVIALFTIPFFEVEALALFILLFSIALYQFAIYKLQKATYTTLIQEQRLLSKKDQQLFINISIIYWFIIFTCWFIIVTYLYSTWLYKLTLSIILFGFIIYLIFTWFYIQKKAQK